jgi:hypothetical protein
MRQYKDMIKDTASDLEEHLQQVNEKLQAISLQGTRISNQDAAQRERIQEERDSAQKCLEICAMVSNSFKDIPISLDIDQKPLVATSSGLLSAQPVTVNAVEECKHKLAATSPQLETHIQDLKKHTPGEANDSRDMAVERERIREELESTKQCLAICTKASEKAYHGEVNKFEDITMGHDAHQVIITTLGDLISAKRATTGFRSTRLIGQISDDAMQQLSRHLKFAAIKSDEEVQAGAKAVPPFIGRYGTGMKLDVGSVKSDDVKS